MDTKASDRVSIFDLQNLETTGYGARALPIVDENGSILELRILDGGQNYNPEYLGFSYIGNGYGFEANSTATTVADGVIESIDIIHPGSGYAIGQNYSVEIVEGTGGTGSGFSATIDGGDIKNGVIMVELLNGGYGYTSEPTVILRGENWIIMTIHTLLFRGVEWYLKLKPLIRTEWSGRFVSTEMVPC